MKRIVYTLSGLALVLTFLNNSGGRASGGGDNTGRTGTSATCQQCHNSGSFANPTTVMTITRNGMPVTGYVPGQIYDVSLTVSSTTAGGKFGFSAVAVKKSDNTTNAGSLTAVTSGTMIHTLGGRQYAEQHMVLSNGLVQFKWTAPATGFGVVKFYAAGNVVNGTGSTGGDNGTPSISLELAEAVSTVQQANLIAAMTAYPNPTQNILNLKVVPTEVGDYTIEVSDLAGRLLQKEAITLQAGENIHSIAVNNLTKGVYAVRLVREGKNAATATFVKD